MKIGHKRTWEQAFIKAAESADCLCLVRIMRLDNEIERFKNHLT